MLECCKMAFDYTFKTAILPNCRRFNMLIRTCLDLFTVSLIATITLGIRIIHRKEWLARPALSLKILEHPVPMVIVHQSGFRYARCNNTNVRDVVRDMQKSDMDIIHKVDIGYNYVVGCDGNVYEGTAWLYEGQHTDLLNNKSIGICLMGYWVDEKPPAIMLDAVRELIKEGVENGYLKKDYWLMGHNSNGPGDKREEDTECPGYALNEELKTWDRWGKIVEHIRYGKHWSSLNMKYEKGISIIHRKEWLARPARALKLIEHPVPMVIVHHSGYRYALCNDTNAKDVVRNMQKIDMDVIHKVDIGYNFVVGCDGKAYEGTAWLYEGQHTDLLNNKSIGICLMGYWVEKKPPAIMLDTVREIIKEGVEKGYIKKDYWLMGHNSNGLGDKREEDTECPGHALNEELKTWDRWGMIVEHIRYGKHWSSLNMKYEKGYEPENVYKTYTKYFR